MNPFLKISLAVLAVAVLGWLAFGFFGIQALFLDNEVEEEIPEFVVNLESQPGDQAASEEGSAEQQLLGRGSFTQGDSTYSIAGNAFLSRIEGQLNLTFTDFEVSNGPDLFVYAVQVDSTDNDSLKEAVANGGFINLGALKGNIGNQSYTLETEWNSEEYPVIAIWCQRFGRNFGSVLLTPGTPASNS